MRIRVLAPVLAGLVALSACGGAVPGAHGGDDGTVVVWTVEDEAGRVAAQRRLLADFTRSTGVRTELVAVAENEVDRALDSAAAAGELPDVVGAVPLAGVRSLHAKDLLDERVAGQVVKALGRDTFTPAALELTSDRGRLLAVPSDGWAQLLFYRKDLFEAAGLARPETFADIAAAAAALHRGTTAGIVAGTAPDDTFTQQSFEHFALANGCQLVGEGGGEPMLDSPACVETFRFYSRLMRDHSVPGDQTADSTRALYLAGRAGMVVWSSFLLDELAGLREDAVPACAPCRRDRGFLAANTGVVPALRGPSGPQPASFGEVVSWVALEDSADASRRLIEHMLGDGYERWLALAPEGKVPTRVGTQQDPRRFVRAWERLGTGDRQAPLSRFYARDVLEAVSSSPAAVDRWGLPQGEGALVGALTSEFTVPKALSVLIRRGWDPAAAAHTVDEAARAVQDRQGQDGQA